MGTSSLSRRHHLTLPSLCLTQSSLGSSGGTQVTGGILTVTHNSSLSLPTSPRLVQPRPEAPSLLPSRPPRKPALTCWQISAETPSPLPRWLQPLLPSQPLEVSTTCAENLSPPHISLQSHAVHWGLTLLWSRKNRGQESAWALFGSLAIKHVSGGPR